MSFGTPDLSFLEQLQSEKEINIRNRRASAYSAKVARLRKAKAKRIMFCSLASIILLVGAFSYYTAKEMPRNEVVVWQE